jgi:hypothetical protein
LKIIVRLVSRINMAFRLLGGCAIAFSISSKALAADHWLPVAPRASVISTVGIEASLCALLPTMSASAVRQVLAFLDAPCTPSPPYSKAAVWIPAEWPLAIDQRVGIMAYADVFLGNSPFNDAINSWLREQRALPLSVNAPIVFAAASTLHHQVNWQLLQTVHETVGPFRGLHGTRTVKFVDGIKFGAFESLAECDRIAISMADVGTILVTKEASRDRLAACFGHRRKSHTYADETMVGITGLDLHSTSQLGELLRQRGVRAVFNSAADPFPGLHQGIALNASAQSARLHLGRFGIDVQATTLTDFAVGSGPHGFS